MLKNFFLNNRLYQALSFAYDQSVKHKLRHPEVSRLRHVGQHSEIHDDVTITHPDRVWIGDWTTIFRGSYIHSMGGLHVGNYVGIGCRCTIMTFNHVYRMAGAIPFDNRVFLQPVIIRDFAWVGWNTKILPGVEIGEGAIVSLGSVVTTDVPPLGIVMGNPAKVIGFRSRDHFEACLREGRITPHRVRERYQQYEESIPLMVRRKYARELSDLGLLDSQQA